MKPSSKAAADSSGCKYCCIPVKYYKLHGLNGEGAELDFGQAIASGFKKYVTFSGRASRSEYWYWVLFSIIGSIVTATLDYAVFSENDFASPLNSIFALVCFLPSLAVGIRRLHDIGRTGWWTLIAFTIIGIIVLIVWACQKSDSGSNAYGPEPVGVATSPATA